MAVNEIPQQAIIGTVDVAALQRFALHKPIQSLVEACKKTDRVLIIRNSLRDNDVLGEESGKTIGMLIAFMLPNTASNEPVVSDLVKVVEQNFSLSSNSNTLASRRNTFWHDLENELGRPSLQGTTNERFARAREEMSMTNFSNPRRGCDHVSTSESPTSLQHSTTGHRDSPIPPQSVQSARQYEERLIPSTLSIERMKHVKQVSSMVTSFGVLRDDYAYSEIGENDVVASHIPLTPISMLNTSGDLNHSRLSFDERTESLTQHSPACAHVSLSERSPSNDSRPREEMAIDDFNEGHSLALLSGVEDFL